MHIYHAHMVNGRMLWVLLWQVEGTIRKKREDFIKMPLKLEHLPGPYQCNKLGFPNDHASMPIMWDDILKPRPGSWIPQVILSYLIRHPEAKTEAESRSHSWYDGSTCQEAWWHLPLSEVPAWRQGRWGKWFTSWLALQLFKTTACVITARKQISDNLIALGRTHTPF